MQGAETWRDQSKSIRGLSTNLDVSVPLSYQDYSLFNVKYIAEDPVLRNSRS